MPGTIRSVIRGSARSIRSDGDFVRDYFYVEDGAAAYMLLAEKLAADRALAGEAFNFSNEAQVTVSDHRCEDSQGHGQLADSGHQKRSDQRDSTAVPGRVQGPQQPGMVADVHVGRRVGANDRLVPPVSERMTFHCRACGSSDLLPVLALGRTPLANALVNPADADATEETFPLNLVRCRACTLVQIDETVPPEKLFRHYAYFSSFSDTMVEHARIMAMRLVEERRLGPTSLAMEVASNDGYLLQHYVAAGIPVLGIEPAENIAAIAREKGVQDRLGVLQRPLCRGTGGTARVRRCDPRQ